VRVDSSGGIFRRPIRSLLAYDRIRSECEECCDPKDKYECREEDTSSPARSTWDGQLAIVFRRIELGPRFGRNARWGIEEFLEARHNLITIRPSAGCADEVFVQRHGPSR
jgi:hypothetical protein